VVLRPPLLGGLILPQSLERGVPELAIRGPGSKLDLGNKLRLNPLGQIASDVAGRPAAGERRFVNLERVKLLPELPRGRCRVPGARAPDMGQLSVPILAENKGADCTG
jgi:hypothetical protein